MILSYRSYFKNVIFYQFISYVYLLIYPILVTYSIALVPTDNIQITKSKRCALADVDCIAFDKVTQ